MSYKITITNDGNHITNPLLKLAGCEYATREEACEAIYAALYSVIDGENGCEMVARAELPPRLSASELWKICEPAEYRNGYVVASYDVDYDVSEPPKIERQTDMGANYSDEDIEDFNCVCETMGFELVDARDANAVLADRNFEYVDSFRASHEAYIAECRDYIMREGYAREDGVSASVEEVA